MLENTVSAIDLSPKEAEFNPQAIEDLLEEKDMTQAELARIAGYKHRNVVNRIIRQKKKADATDLIKFCLAFNKPIEAFTKKI